MGVRSWTKEQEQAIHAAGGTILVSAAAGSGKTAVLTQRILSKLTDPEHPVPINRILACTFSNAAAAEMKERIGAAITDQLLLYPDQTFLRKQQVLLSTAAIGTVHGFCHKLLKENFHLSGLDPSFSIAESTQQSLLMQQALEETLEQAYAKEGAQDGGFSLLAAAHSRLADDSPVGELILSVYRLIMSVPFPERWLDEKEALYNTPTDCATHPIWQLLFAAVCADFSVYVRMLDTLLDEISDFQELTDKGYQKPFAADFAFAAAVLEQAKKQDPDRLFALLSDYQAPRLVSVRDIYAEERASFKLRRDEIKAGFVRWQKIVSMDKTAFDTELERVRPEISALFDAVRLFASLYAAKKAEKQLLDFNDLEHKTLDLLLTHDPSGGDHPTALAKQIADAYDEILLDEYQDINGVQEAIFKAISREDTNRFLVGDMKQGIYGFRLADPTLFAEKKRRFSPYAAGRFPAKITLGRNFRSRKEITDFVNRIFSRIMHLSTGGLEYGEEDALVAGAAYFDPPAPPVSLAFLEAGDKKPLLVQADYMAKEIRRLLDEGYPVQDKTGSRPCRPGDFAILLRTVKNSALPILQALQRQGINGFADTGEAFFETREISFLYALLQAIDNPLLDLPVCATLTGPVFDFDATDLGRIAAAAKEEKKENQPFYLRLCDYAKTGDDPALRAKCKAFSDQLRIWRTQAAARSADAMLRQILEDTDLLNRMRMLQNGAERVARLHQLVSLAAAQEKNSTIGLSGLVRLFRDWEEKGVRPESALSFPEGDSVRVLSIHKSKGLEFPLVFVADLQKTFNLQDASKSVLQNAALGLWMKGRLPEIQGMYETLPHKLVAQQIRSENKSEEIRILYVAMTRARERLCLVSCGKSILPSVNASLEKARCFSKELPYYIARQGGLLPMLLGALADHQDFSELSFGFHQGTDRVLPLDISFVPAEEEKAHTEEEETFAPLPEPDPQMVEALHRQLDFVYPHLAEISAPAKRTVSQLKKETDPAAEDALTALTPPAFLSPAEKTGAARGTAAHLLLEKADFAAARTDLSGEIDRLVRVGLLTKEEAEAVEQPHLEAFFQSALVGRILSGGTYYKEQRLLFPLPLRQVDPALDSDEQMILQGVADCIYQTAGGYGILDYKTDHVRTADVLLERYTRQLQLYALGTMRLLGAPVTELFIYSLALDLAIPVPLPKPFASQRKEAQK